MVEIGGGKGRNRKGKGNGGKEREWGKKKKGNREKSPMVLEHKRFTKLFTLNCSTVISMSHASFWG